VDSKLIAEIIGRLYVKNRRNWEPDNVDTRPYVVHTNSSVCSKGRVSVLPRLYIVEGLARYKLRPIHAGRGSKKRTTRRADE